MAVGRKWPAIAAVIFDMDGLLLDSERLSMEALGAAGQAIGVDMPEQFCRSLIGSPFDRCRTMLLDRNGADFPMERYMALYDSHLAGLVDAGRLVLKQGVAELLLELDRRRLPRAVATSSGRARAVHHLDAVGLRDRFDAVLTRDDVLRGKPHPDLFLAAAARLGVVPDACLALEDSHQGVRAAHAAGMRVVMVPDLLEADEDMRGMAHRITGSLHEVVALLD